MRWICRYRTARLTATMTVAGIIMSACGVSSDSENQNILPQNFASRVLPSGDSPGEWNIIWGCDIKMHEGSYTLVPLRFYRDGQLHAGIGTSEVLGTWELNSPPGQPSNKPTISLSLDEPAPEMFGTVSQQLRFNMIRAGDTYMQSDSLNIAYNSVALRTYEDATAIGIDCARYNVAGSIEGEDDLPFWLSRFDDTPNFLLSGEVSIQLIPRPLSPFERPSSSEPDSTSDEPTADEPTSQPDQTTTEPDSNPTTTDTPLVNRPSSAAPLAEITAQIKDIWFTTDLVDTVDGVRQRNGSVIEFNNGEVSNDGDTISKEGIAVSKRENPLKWGEGRVSANGLLSYKWSASRSWLEPYLSAPFATFTSNQKITGCYEASVGVETTFSSLRIDRICFSNQGEYSINFAGENAGIYQLDDHAIRFNFSDGNREEFLFGTYSNEGLITRIVIADTLYYVFE